MIVKLYLKSGSVIELKANCSIEEMEDIKRDEAYFHHMDIEDWLESSVWFDPIHVSYIERGSIMAITIAFE